MSDLRKAAQLMLDSVEQMLSSGEWYCARERADALRAALQDEPDDTAHRMDGLPHQEPTAWMYYGIRFDNTPHNCASLVWRAEYMDAMSASKGVKAIPLYAAPPQRPLLTDDEVLDAVRDCGLDWHAGYDLDERNRYEMLARAIERKVRGEEE